MDRLDGNREENIITTAGASIQQRKEERARAKLEGKAEMLIVMMMMMMKTMMSHRTHIRLHARPYPFLLKLSFKLSRWRVVEIAPPLNHTYHTPTHTYTKIGSNPHTSVKITLTPTSLESNLRYRYHRLDLCSSRITEPVWLICKSIWSTHLLNSNSAHYGAPVIILYPFSYYCLYPQIFFIIHELNHYPFPLNYRPLKVQFGRVHFIILFFYNKKFIYLFL